MSQTTDYQQVLQDEIQELQKKADTAKMPEELRRKVKKDIIALKRSVELGSYDVKYETVSKYIDWVLRLPWEEEAIDRLDVKEAKNIFDKHHYGMHEVKNRFLEYIAVLKLRKQNYAQEEFRAPILLLVGLVGTGKTTFGYALAEALGRPLVRIPFGGMGSAKDLRGSSRLVLGSEPGRVIKGLCQSEVKNPVVLLDEVDRASDEANQEIMGVLIELLDPAQNHAFTDSYIDYPVDLSKAIFLATANNTVRVPTAVLDRVERIDMPSYTDHEKLMIAQQYVLPGLLKQAGLKPGQFIIKEDVWPNVIRPLGFDAGIRTLQRTLQGAVRKAARIIVERGFDKVIITQENREIFLPKY
jgi:ATP-dependent Lon protease